MMRLAGHDSIQDFNNNNNNNNNNISRIILTGSGTIWFITQMANFQLGFVNSLLSNYQTIV